MVGSPFSPIRGRPRWTSLPTGTQRHQRIRQPTTEIQRCTTPASFVRGTRRPPSPADAQGPRPPAQPRSSSPANESFRAAYFVAHHLEEILACRCRGLAAKDVQTTGHLGGEFGFETERKQNYTETENRKRDKVGSYPSIRLICAGSSTASLFLAGIRSRSCDIERPAAK